MRSEAENWDEAKLEWSLDSIYFSQEAGRCLCGHMPIKEHCVLLNCHNGNEVIVGNVCVKKFLGLDSDTLFQALRRISSDPTRALNADTVDYLYRQKLLTSWERGFYLDTLRKRKLSQRQMAKRVEINRFIIGYVQHNNLQEV